LTTRSITHNPVFLAGLQESFVSTDSSICKKTIAIHQKVLA
jgi:hypothetical protein